ncbi:MAG: DegT/DnrJ/EryC1/StrS aminotransferase [Betaproteobacteria bacterium]|nr:DegT/DnrJ/EryC1/StrS aminotransferase [Betaproteobacteria bacterium]
MPVIPLLVPDMPTAEELLPWLRRIDASRRYTNFGPLSGELEMQLASRFDATPGCTVSVANCTLGLELTLAALGLRRGARVLMPAMTFVATATAVLRAGMCPVLADVEADSWALSPRIARAAVRGKAVDCVMPVATFGCAQDAAAWDGFVGESGIPVVIDAAGAFGNQRAGERVHQVFSLHATKSLGIGEGGFLLTPDAAIAECVRRLTNFGIELPSGIVPVAGTNAKLSEYHAAVGLAALAAWDGRAGRRRALAARYESALRGACPALAFQARPSDGVYTIFPVHLPEWAHPPAVAASLAGHGVETRRWYYPLLSEHPAFREADIVDGLPTARGLSGRILGLPFHLHFSVGDLERICAAVAAAVPGA